MTVFGRLTRWVCRGSAGTRRSRGRRVVLAVAHLASLGLLFLALLAAIVSLRIEPFHGWLEDTPLEGVGRAVVGFVSRQDLLWRRRLAGAPLLKDEIEARDLFVSEILRIRPTHAVALRDESALFGHLEKTGPDTLEFTSETEDGVTTRVLTADQVVWQRQIEYAPVELLPEDVRFLMQFPDLKHYYIPPYLFATDTLYSYVHVAHGVLNRLSEQFLGTFRVLVTDEVRTKLAYVCFFRDEEQYLEYAIRKEDVPLETTVGFYSQEQDCLFLYDRLRSFARNRIDRSIDELADAARIRSGLTEDRILALAEAERERSYDILVRQVVRTLRHEGAHQLAFSLGVHSAEGFEHLWLQEGLAQYCETDPIGQPIPGKFAELRTALAAHRLVPWHELVDTPSGTGFGSHGNRATVAYAQSWLLFHTLMQPPYRARFLKYMDSVRCLEAAALNRRRSEVLAEVVDTPFLKIVRDVQELIAASDRGGRPDG